MDLGQFSRLLIRGLEADNWVAAALNEVNSEARRKFSQAEDNPTGFHLEPH